MATGTAGTVARHHHTHQMHYLRKEWTYLDDGVVLTVGVLPAGAVIHKPMSGVDVQVATNAGTNNLMDIGTTADDDLYATNLSTASIAFVPLDEAVSMKVAADTTITATLDLTGTAATAGAGSIVIAYTLPDKA
jgi:hypothetical protein